MQVEIKIDASYTDPKIIILTAAMTKDLSLHIKANIRYASGCMKSKSDWPLQSLSVYQMQMDIILPACLN